MAGLPPSIAQRSSSNQLPTASRQSSSGALPQGAQPPVPGPRPPPGAPLGPPQAALNPRPGVAPPRPPPGPPPPGHPAAVLAPPPMPGQWPRPQFVHTGAGMSKSVFRPQSLRIMHSISSSPQWVLLLAIACQTWCCSPVLTLLIISDKHMIHKQNSCRWRQIIIVMG